VPLVSYNSPLYSLKGLLKRANAASLLQLYRNRHAGLIAKRPTPNPDAPTQTEINMTNIHVLDGPLHTISAKTPGHFLKATGPANFAFAPHGLTAPDVGALPVAAQAADSDKLDGQHAAGFLAAGATAVDSDKLDGSHASAFEPAISAPSDASKIWDGTKTFRYNDRLVASDGTPNPALSADAAGNVTAVADLILGSTPSTFRFYNTTYGLQIRAANSAISVLTENDGLAKALYLFFSSTNFLKILSPNGAVATSVATISTYAGRLNLAPAAAQVGINNNAPACALDVTGAIAASTTLTLPAMSTAGFVKNSVAGLLSGGNALAAADIPATLNPTAVKAAAEGGTPLDIRTASATFGAGQDLSLLHYQSAYHSSSTSTYTLLSIPIPQDTACLITATITAIPRTTPTDAIAYIMTGLYTNDAGTAHLVGSVKTIYSEDTDLPSTIAFTVNGASIDITATPSLSRSINWAITATRHIAYSATP